MWRSCVGLGVVYSEIQSDRQQRVKDPSGWNNCTHGSHTLNPCDVIGLSTRNRNLMSLHWQRCGWRTKTMYNWDTIARRMISHERFTLSLVCRRCPGCSAEPPLLPNPRLYSARYCFPSSLQGPVTKTAEIASSLPSLAAHWIGPNKKAFTQLIKRHHKAVCNAQFTHLIQSPAPPLSSLISIRVNLQDSYCVDFSSIQWSRGSIMTLFLVFYSISWSSSSSILCLKLLIQSNEIGGRETNLR